MGGSSPSDLPCGATSLTDDLFGFGAGQWGCAGDDRDAAKIEFGGALTLIHNATEDELVCSGKIKATDVLIVGTSTTVADLIGEVATLRQEMAAVKQFVGMMPPPASPPPAATPLPQGHQCYHVGVQHYSGSSCHSTHSDGSYAIITVECARNISSEILVNAGCASCSLDTQGTPDGGVGQHGLNGCPNQNGCGFQVTQVRNGEVVQPSGKSAGFWNHCGIPHGRTQHPLVAGQWQVGDMVIIS